jgi:hypothetical protein
VPTAALVTNLAVHLKRGHESSLVWVTTLDEGKPADRAEVAIRDCGGTVLWQGKTDRDGIARVGRLSANDALPSCRDTSPEARRIPFYDYPLARALRSLDEGLLVTARLGEDLSFVHSSWDDGIEPWRFKLPGETSEGPVVARTILDRSLFRAGDTVHMKHVLREKTLGGFSHVGKEERPVRLSIRHLGSDEKYELPLEWDEAGISESTWTIPKAAKLGRYEVVLIGPTAKREDSGGADQAAAPPPEWTAGSFRVEEFRVPLMKGTLQLPAEPQVAVSEVPVDVTVRYLAGGAAAHLPVTLRSLIRPAKIPAFEGFEGFTFGNGSVEEGISRRGSGEDQEGAGAGKPAIHQREILRLDGAGAARATISELPREAIPRELLAEIEFRDPNGESQTVASTVPLWPAKRLMGIKPDSWVASKHSVKAKVAVVDVSGRAVAGAPVVVDLFERRNYSHRKRIVGGFYAYEHVTETRRVGELCRGRTNAKGLFDCEGKSPVDGNLILRVSSGEEVDAAAPAHGQVWVAGSEQWWFRVQDSDRIDLLPEKRSYEPGETARVQVRMPFPKATALVTLEREGVLDARVVSLSGKEPVIEVPVKENFAPNMFISVLAVRGRTRGVQPTAMIDLGKPAFKLGVAEIQVGWRAHQLEVRVTPEREVYRVRDKARVDVVVRTADGKAPPEESEIAVAAVDEGLLELLPNESWKLLDAMMGRRGYGVETATAQMQVVGKRHYGVKALPQGGGGGQQPTRELFDTLLLWKGRVRLDWKGRAVIEFPLNDSLTSFRVVAIATGGVALFGTGSVTIRSSQDLMVLAGTAPLVREGDSFPAEFTVRNTTKRAMEVTVNAKAQGLVAELGAQKVSLAPGEARAVAWNISVPVGVEEIRYEVTAAEAGDAKDRVRVDQKVSPVVPVRTYQATLLQLEGPIRQPVERPKDAIPERGGVRVSLGASLTQGLAGVREWMARYPYSCLEQRVSRAVALREEKLWQEIISILPAHLDSDGLLKYFPTMPSGSEVLTSYVMAVTHEAGWEIPGELRERMAQGLRDFVEGKIRREPSLPTADLSIRKLAALEALSRYGKADPALLGSVTIEPNLWPTSAVLDWWSLLHRVSAIPDRDARLEEAGQIVRSRLNIQGTTMGFSTGSADNLWWLMVCADTNPVRLLLGLLERNEWGEDLPRILRGALGRQRRGRWDCTVTNAWGTLAVEKFSRAFEAAPVLGTTTVSLEPRTEKVEWPTAGGINTLGFAWPLGTGDLAIGHEGTGKPWITVESRAAIPLREALSSGFRITKRTTPVEPRSNPSWSRGDLVRVRLEVESQSDMTWVVVNDPIPAGASILGTGLATDSEIGTVGEKEPQWRARPVFEERAFDSYRAYYDFVPKGRFSVEYTIRLNQVGSFQLPATRVEALYAPEIFGELPNAPLGVLP